MCILVRSVKFQEDTGNMAGDQRMNRACPGQDIISEIPDVLRLHILTLLSRKDAVRTGALSTKWKDLWKERFCHQTTLTFGRATQSDEEQKELATEIKEQMKQHGDKKVEIFNLCFYPGHKHEKMTAEWVEQAVKNGVEEFNLDFSQGGMGSYPARKIAGRAKKFELKERFFQCTKFLTTLNLKYCRMQRYFKFKYFTNLESLSLRRVNINDQMLECLVYKCQNLEILELTHCKPLKHIKVSTWPTRLKKLIISSCWSAKVVEISAPLLKTFHFYGKCPDSFVMFQNMPMLSDVIITAPVRNDLYRKYPHALLFLWLDHVQVLTLCSSILLLMFGVTNTTWLIFEKLKELQLLMEMVSSDDLNNIYRLFAHCQFPHLERLFIELPPIAFDHSYHIRVMRCLQSPPEMTMENLKMIKMNNFKGHLNEKLLLEFFLQRAIRLERVILVFPREYATVTTTAQRMAFFKEIMTKPRASPNAKLVWFYTNQEDYIYRAVQAEFPLQLCEIGL